MRNWRTQISTLAIGLLFAACAIAQTTPANFSEKPVLEIVDPGIGHAKRLMQYSIRVYRDGGAVFHGEDSHGDLKTIHYSISKERLAYIERKFEELGFQLLRDRYVDVLGESSTTLRATFTPLKPKQIEFALTRSPIQLLDLLRVLNEELQIDRFRCPRFIAGADECENERVAFQILYKRKSIK